MRIVPGPFEGIARVQMAHLIVWLSLCTTLVLGNSNCTRLFNSAVINNQTLYIDGGDMHTLFPNGSIEKSAIRDLQTVDLSRSWQNSDDDLFTYIRKPHDNSDTDDNPPWLNEGAAWSNGQDLFFYGGYLSEKSGISVPPLATWRYDIAAKNWTRSGFWGTPLVRLCQGGAVQSSVDQMAYYLGGSLNPAGNPTFINTPGADVYMDPGLIALNMNTLEWTNASTADMNTWGTIGDGFVGLIDSVGKRGLLVAFGGYTYPVGQKLSFLAARQTDESNQNSMETVRVYDIDKQRWYDQQTSGDVPHWRMAGCAVVAPAPDLSSYSIYVFGGMADKTKDSDGNVYVLSVPSFRWIKVYDDHVLRYKHKCVLAQKHTMLAVGGIIPIDDMEYYPQSRNCDSSTFANGIGIFDLRKLSWMSNYNADDHGEYTIPSKIVDVIGGSETGGATLAKPQHGFNSSDLENLFKHRSVRPTASVVANPTGSPASTHQPAAETGHTLSGGTIAGAVVGAVAGVALLAGLIMAWVIVQRRRKEQGASRQDGPPWAKGASDTWMFAPRPPEELDAAPVYELSHDRQESWCGAASRVEMPTEANRTPELPTSRDR